MQKSSAIEPPVPDGQTPEHLSGEYAVWTQTIGKRFGKLWARLTGASTSRTSLREMLEEVQLSKSENTLVGGFSAGMCKRLTLLRIQLEKPRIVLLDEPFSSLDVNGKELISEWIRNLQSKRTTVIMASHAMERAHRLCTRGILLEEGQIAFQGSPEEVADRMGRHI